MSLLAEELVEEWLNRDGFFTIRNIKAGVGEMDLLAIKPDGSRLICRHIEVQDSVNPVSYICGLPHTLQSKLGLGAFSAKRRTKRVMQESVREWIDKKFRHERKISLRNALAPGPWQEELVVNAVEFPEELKFIEKQRINVHTLDTIVRALLAKKKPRFTATGANLVNLLRTATTANRE